MLWRGRSENGINTYEILKNVLKVKNTLFLMILPVSVVGK